MYIYVELNVLGNRRRLSGEGYGTCFRKADRRLDTENVQFCSLNQSSIREGLDDFDLKP
jgi:hypothetical protein